MIVGRRFGDWVCKECRRSNHENNEYCDKCGKHRQFKLNKQIDMSKITEW